MAGLQAAHASKPRKLGGDRAVRSDDKAARQPRAERIGGAQHHGGRGLADSERTDCRTVRRPGERGAHAAAPVDGRDGGSEQVEEQRPARIGTREGDFPLQRSDCARGPPARQIKQALGAHAVGTLVLDAREVLARHVAGHVDAVEARGLEAVMRGLSCRHALIRASRSW